jgi:hypothetical protein
MYYALGTGGAEDANLRTREAMTKVRVGLKNLAGDKNFATCSNFLLALSDSVEKWFEAYLVAARTVASETCRPVLSKAGDLWTRCEGDYRRGFKVHVRDHLKKWFEEQSPRSMHVSVEEGFQRAWTENVIRALEDALGIAVPRNDVFNSL